MTKLTQDEIAGLDAIHAAHGRKWRDVVEKDWYNGTSRNIGNAVYCLRNREHGHWRGLDAYAALLKARKAKA